MRLSLAMKSEQIKIIPEMLSGDEHQGLRTSIYSIFLEYEQAQSQYDRCIFCRKRCHPLENVDTQLNSLDDEEFGRARGVKKRRFKKIDAQSISNHLQENFVDIGLL